MGKVYLVCASDYEYHAVFGAFSTEQAAQDYVGELQKHQGSNSYGVEEFETDPPRRTLPGAWDVTIDPSTGKAIKDEARFETSSTPDNPPQTQQDRDGIYGYRAWGVTRGEAIARAQQYRLEQLSPPPSPGA